MGEVEERVRIFKGVENYISLIALPNFSPGKSRIKISRLIKCCLINQMFAKLISNGSLLVASANEPAPNLNLK